MFLLKKVVAPLFFPVSICLEILLCGLVLLWFTRRQRAGKIVVSTGSIAFALLSFGAVPNMMLRPLEYKYSPVLNVTEASGVNWVVVLGGGHTSNPKLPATSRLSSVALVRLVEGIRLQRLIPGGKLILSGGGAFDPVPEAETMAKIALSLGIDKQDLILESSSKDTKDEARIIKEMVGNERFYLVTSAYHMLRSVALFRKEGMTPIPAPTGHHTHMKVKQQYNPNMFLPSAGNLLKAERAVYECLGLAWAKIQGQI